MKKCLNKWGGRRMERVMLVTVELLCYSSNFLSIPLLSNLTQLGMPEQKAM